MGSEVFFEVAHITKLIKAAKDDPVNFAFGNAGAPDKNMLAVDKTKSGEQLFAAIKKAGLNKGFWGTVAFDGSNATFIPAKPGSGQQKMLEDWFRRNKVSLKAVIAGPQDGGEDEAEDEEQPKGAARDEAPDAAKAADDKSRGGKGKDDAEEDEAEEDEAALLVKIFTTPEIVKNLNRARKGPVSFAFGIGAEAGTNLLALHPRQEGKRLALTIKKSNHAAKGSFGTLTVEGKLASFICEKAPVPGLKKLIRAFFKDRKIGYKVAVLGPEGPVVEADDGPDEDFDENAPDIVADSPSDAGDTDAGGGQDLAGLKAELDGLLPRLKEVFTARPELADEIRALYKECGAAIKANDAGEAGRLLDRLASLAGDETDPKARWKKARQAWQAAIEAVDQQMTALGAALRKTGDEELATIADRGLNGVTGNFRVPLMSAVFELDAANGEAFDKAAAKALGVIAGFRKHLNDDQRVAACDGNPFGIKVSLKETLGGALGRLESALKS